MNESLTVSESKSANQNVLGFGTRPISSKKKNANNQLTVDCEFETTVGNSNSTFSSPSSKSEGGTTIGPGNNNNSNNNSNSNNNESSIVSLLLPDERCLGYDSETSMKKKRNQIVNNVREKRSNSLVTKRDRQKAFGGYEDSVHSEDLTGEFLRMKLGYLRKENRRGRWNKRFFATNNAYLNYYKKKANYKSGDRAQLSASIDLRAASTICILSRNGKPTTKFAIQTTRKGSTHEETECFFLRAASVSEAFAWVTILNERRTYWCKSSLRPFEAIENNPSDLKRKSKSSDKKKLFHTSPSVPSKMNNFEDLELSNNSQYESDNLILNVSASGYSQSQQNEIAWWQETNNSSSSAEDGNPSSDEGFVTGEEESIQSSSEEENFESDENSRRHLGRKRRNRNRGIDSCDKESVERMQNFPEPYGKLFWLEPDVRKLRIRGKQYLENSQKIQATEPLFTLAAVDLYKTKGRFDHIASHPKSRMALVKERGDVLPFVFMVHIQIPGPPFYSFVAYFVAKKETSNAIFRDKLSVDDLKITSEHKDLALRFFKGEDDELRNDRFKLVPRIVEGPFIVRRGVPSKPALLGRKLTQRYFRGDNYLELCVDVGSSIVAWKITQMSVGYAKLLTCDLAIVLQGNRSEELPEMVLGIVRCAKIDMGAAMDLHEDEDKD